MDINVSNVRKVLISYKENDNIGGEESQHRHMTIVTEEGKVNIALHGPDLKVYSEENGNLVIE